MKYTAHGWYVHMGTKVKAVLQYELDLISKQGSKIENKVATLEK